MTIGDNQMLHVGWHVRQDTRSGDLRHDVNRQYKMRPTLRRQQRDALSSDQCPAGAFPAGLKWRIAKSSGMVASVSHAMMRKQSMKASRLT
jgi:hypothetical protein